ncbi:capsular polysaccharide transport system permease protein [Brevundimonas faecalis]|uniref:Capsular polysaccharide transport system permease protein n=2 Tax=Brevundimonas faecalis TaxID=947378 RepID=A0ABV2R7B0_9CAUL
MTHVEVEYRGPKLGNDETKIKPRQWWRRLPLSFLGFVVAPTLAATVYFTLIATPQYVSEARFIVRQPSQPQPSGLGVALQGIGLPAGQADAFAVHEFVLSRTGMQGLAQDIDLPLALRANHADPLARYPRPWEGRSQEDLFEAYLRFVEVGYDSSTGISTLRARAFRPEDARKMTASLLARSERLVNQLNERAASNAVQEALQSRDDAIARRDLAQGKLTSFRNTSGIIDPSRTASEMTQLIGGLLEQVAALKAEKAQLTSLTPSSPQIEVINARIRAYEDQISIERAKMAGATGSLAPQIGGYEDLLLAREIADREVTQTTAAYISARNEARRQQLYLDRIVEPNLPDKSTEPRRLVSILIVLMSTLSIYGLGWLVWAGIREHRQ